MREYTRDERTNERTNELRFRVNCSLVYTHVRTQAHICCMFREMRVIRVYVCTYITDGSIGGIARANAIHTARQMRSSSFRRVRVKGCPNNIPFTESPPHPPPASNLVRPRAPPPPPPRSSIYILVRPDPCPTSPTIDFSFLGFSIVCYELSFTMTRAPSP